MSKLYNMSYRDVLREFEGYGEYEEKAIDIYQNKKELEFWNKTKRKNTQKAYKEYIKKYPNGKYIIEADRSLNILIAKQKKLEEKRQKAIEEDRQSWNLIKNSNKIEDIKEFLNKYPNGMYYNEAKKLYKMMKLEISNSSQTIRLYVDKLDENNIRLVDNKKNIVTDYYKDIKYIKTEGLKKDGRLSVPFKYDKPINILDINLIQVQCKNNLYGLINHNGKIVIECNYSNEFYFNFNFFKENTIKTELWNQSLVFAIIYNFELEVKDPAFMSIFDKSVVKIVVQEKLNSEGYPDNYFGIINKNGKVLLEPIYSYIKLLRNGLGIIINKDGREGLINSKFQLLLEPKYDFIRDNKNGSMYIYESKGNLLTVGLVNSKGKIIYPIQASSIEYIEKNHLHLVCEQIHNSDVYSLINENGKYITDVYFHEIKVANNNLFEVRIDNKYGVINKRGEYIFKVEYDYISIRENFIEVHKHFSIGLSDFKGKFILELEWPIVNITEEFVIFTNKKQSGVMNHKGQILLEHGKYWESSIKIRKHPKTGQELLEYGTIMHTGLIDSQGNEIIPFMNNFKYNIAQTKFFKNIWI